jgi:hypothetical protein
MYIQRNLLTVTLGDGTMVPIWREVAWTLLPPSGEEDERWECRVLSHTVVDAPDTPCLPTEDRDVYMVGGRPARFSRLASDKNLERFTLRFDNGDADCVIEGEMTPVEIAPDDGWRCMENVTLDWFVVGHPGLRAIMMSTGVFVVDGRVARVVPEEAQ